MGFNRNNFFSQKKTVSNYGTFTEENIDLENPNVIELKRIESHPRRSSCPQFSHPLAVMGTLFLFLLGMIGIIFLFRNNSDEDISAFNENNNELLLSYNISDIVQAINDGIDNICQMPTRKALCDGNLGVPRELMPQLSPDILFQYITMKIKQGYEVISTFISPESLMPVENEISAKRVLQLLRKATKHNPCDHNVLVALGNKIIDGHHHAFACLFFGGKQKITLILDTIKNILGELQHVEGVTYQSLMRSP